MKFEVEKSTKVAVILEHICFYQSLFFVLFCFVYAVNFQNLRFHNATLPRPF